MYGSDSTMMAQQNLKKKSKKKEGTKKTEKKKGVHTQHPNNRRGRKEVRETRGRVIRRAQSFF
jgi:hypothetical protein